LPREEGTKPAAVTVAAGSTIRVKLKMPLVLENQAGTAVAVVTEAAGLPAGTTLVGNARALSHGRVAIQYRTATLPDGREMQIDSEAIDLDGGSGIAVEGAASESSRSDQPDLADTRTARSLLSTALSSQPILGALVDDLTDAHRHRRRQEPDPVAALRLEQGKAMDVLFRRRAAL
jgi:type IV secretory pathway VirB10-like protein